MWRAREGERPHISAQRLPGAGWSR
jgi:hypothetical protein